MPVPAYLEVSALFEAHWTGIPTVVAALAAEALNDPKIDWVFIRETLIVPHATIADMLSARSGQLANRNYDRKIWQQAHFDYANASRSKAIFTNIKPVRGLFGQEAMIIYDLSPILTPQFHDSGMVDHFANRFREDVESSVHFFPISEASRGDIETYFGVPRSASTIIAMGVDIDPVSLSTAQAIARDTVVEPYIVVLGTLEPRKNGRLVLEYLIRNPDFAERFRIVFVGRDGWLAERDRLLEKAEASGVGRDRIVFTGFVSEHEKICLLYNAAFCVYASFFEGYGLPILEAAVLGKMIVCSNTSSMPEVSPEQCFFFDPVSISDFAHAISGAEQACEQLQQRAPLSLADLTDRVASHRWSRCYDGIRDWVLS